jgi:ribosomal protein S18 acetylase RimI-like enzyme
MSELVKKRKIKILPAKRKHRLEMKDINEKCLPENYDIYFWDIFISYNNSFILSAGNFVIGYCLCGNEGNIVSFAILPQHRGLGFGNQLLSAALNHLKLKNNSVTLQVRVSNKIAIKLYSSMGFVINKTLENYYTSETRENETRENETSGCEDGYEMVV